MTNSNLPKYKSPPVIETVLSAQFAPLPNFTNAHAGWYWKNYLDSEWDQVVAAPRIDDHFESFDEKHWSSEKGISIFTGPQADRLQIIRSNDHRMIQVQNSRFAYNWRKQQDGEYPSYDKLLPEFKEKFSQFKQFAVDSDNGDLNLNQWEVTYVNHIPKGTLWDSAKDWTSILPTLCVPALNVPKQEFDNFRGVWALTIDGNKGRLHIEIKHVRVGGLEGPEVLVIQFTARGPINSDVDLFTGFDIGHEAIVRSFTDMTSEECHKLWERSV